MNMKAIIPLGLAVVLGLVAAMLVRNAIAHRSSAPTTASNLVTVAVAKADVSPGKALTLLDVGSAKVPADTAPTHVFSDPAQLVGRVVTTQLVKGQTILDTLLADNGTGDGLQALIPAGMRAVTVEVNEYSGVAGMLQPGCRVDLITVMRDEKTHSSVARTILQNIKITAIGRATSPQHPVEGQPAPPPSNSVTLLCTPRQAQVLELASQSSRPWLALRSGRDNADGQVETTTLADLGGEIATQEPVPTQPAAGGVTQTTGSNTATGSAIPAGLFSPDTNTETQPNTYRRNVTIIRGGTESQVTFTIPIPQASTVNTDVDPLLPDTH